jgi:hypothetical protein
LGAPCGTKKVRNRTPWITKPSTVTPMNTATAMKKVTMMWLVKVKLPGIIPSMFPIRMKMKRVKMSGKKRIASLPADSRTMPATNS